MTKEDFAKIESGIEHLLNDLYNAIPERQRGSMQLRFHRLETLLRYGSLAICAVVAAAKHFSVENVLGEHLSPELVKIINRYSHAIPCHEYAPSETNAAKNAATAEPTLFG